MTSNTPHAPGLPRRTARPSMPGRQHSGGVAAPEFSHVIREAAGRKDRTAT
ncbi:hypothetical protein [Nonomuraea wenchangensis]|uniref:hypothetical protein n=1 Tax=Nonomuraea wenchangensis TaxID=568860 RepID=UPI0033E542F6